MIGIIDYNAGNIRSVEHALDSLGIQNIRSKDPRELAPCDRLIFPGDGDAAYAMGELKKTGFDSFLKDAAAMGKPVLGICVGSQIIFDHSEEGDVPCLGLARGTIRHLSGLWKEAGVPPLKVPHMGWNDIEPTAGGGDNPLFRGLLFPLAVYFVHSYAIVPDDPAVVAAAADYGVPVPAAVRSGTILALQFHPEKSGEPGLRMLRNF
ncbi:MAG: imidazole glycerol phosphate synthase subunit HisH, partial [Spirochaetaceae bacterium]|nr:imidazole glycerol phosphate synthase subunit HisH [Spirochaetaceae bacterium]